MIDKKRRQLTVMMGVGVASVPVTALIGTLPSYAAEMVDPSSAQATALGYIEVSEKPDQKCADCALYQGDATAEAGGCSIFPGKDVTAAGWCNAYAPKG